MLLGAMMAGLVVSSTALADETVSVGGTNVVVIKPDAPVGSIVLMAGQDGRIGAAPGGVITLLRGNQLVRTRAAYARRGLAVMVVDAPTDLSSAIQYMAAIKGPVTVAATSNGTVRAAQGIAKGAKPDALVLTSGLLSRQSGGAENVEAILRSPSRLPHTLVIAHRQDGCRVSRPAGVEPFIKWAGGRASVTWLTGGVSEGDPCRGFGYHGFNGLDEEVVSLVAAFH